jgi:hypothetical protein
MTARKAAVGFLVIAAFLAPAHAQEERTYKKIGGIEVATDTPGELVVRWRGVEYGVALEDLPNGPPETPKYVNGFVLGLYEPAGTVYLVAAHEAWQNETWDIFSWDLRTKHTAGIGAEFEGEGTGFITVSPSGRYLAFRELVRSGMVGMCTHDYIGVIDMREKRLALVMVPLSPPGDGGLASIKDIRWTDSNRFESLADINYNSECNQGNVRPDRTQTETIDVTKLAFH